MFETIEEITVAVSGVYALTTGLDRGDVLTHKAITAVLGLKPHEGRWGHIVRKVRRRLEDERGIATWPETTVGYKLCTREEQLDIPGRRLRRAARQARRGRKSVAALPDRALTLHQRRVKAFLLERLRDTELSIRREVRAAAGQFRPTAVLPRPRPEGSET